MMKRFRCKDCYFEFEGEDVKCTRCGGYGFEIGVTEAPIETPVNDTNIPTETLTEIPTETPINTDAGKN